MFVPSSQNLCVEQVEAVEPIVPTPRNVGEVGHTNVLPPVASWHTVKVRCSPAARFVTVELVTFPVSVISNVSSGPALNAGVAENVTVALAWVNPSLALICFVFELVVNPTSPALEITLAFTFVPEANNSATSPLGAVNIAVVPDTGVSVAVCAPSNDIP